MRVGDAGTLFSLDELAALRGTSDARGVRLVAHAWATIAAAMALYAAWPSPLTFAVAFLAIGGRQMGLAVLMHEASHWLLFRRQGANTRVGQWLCAYPLGADVAEYRRTHQRHHRYTQQADDPDLPLTASLPLTRARLLALLLRDVSGWTAIPAIARRRSWRRVRGPLISNAGLFAILAAAGQWHVYPLLWLLPLVTWYPLAVRVRSVSEHGMASVDDDVLRNTRSTSAGVVARAVLAPYWVNYHIEHHLMTFVPCWKLRDVRQLLLRSGDAARMELAPSYLGVLRRVTS